MDHSLFKTRTTKIFENAVKEYDDASDSQPVDIWQLPEIPNGRVLTLIEEPNEDAGLLIEEHSSDDVGLTELHPVRLFDFHENETRLVDFDVDIPPALFEDLDQDGNLNNNEIQHEVEINDSAENGTEEEIIDRGNGLGLHEVEVHEGNITNYKEPTVEYENEGAVSGNREEEDLRLNIDEHNNQEIRGRPKKGRKRKFEDQDRTIRKTKCIQNKQYYSQRGKLVEEKEIRHFICPCECLQKVGEENLETEFKKFYSVESHDAQRALICAMVNEVPIKRKRNKGSEKKKFSRIYKLSGNIVCKPFFIQSLRISSCKIDAALKAAKRPGGVRDFRGKGACKNKIDDIRVQEVTEHINKFPRYKSHYRRSQTEREYLNEDITLPKMYELYKQEVPRPVSVSFYKKVFLTNFNLKRKKLKKDTCNTCDKLHIELQCCNNRERKEVIELKHKTHLMEADDAQKMRKEDMKNAEKDPDLETFCFDLEKTLPLPRIPTNIVYYKRQLCIYNLGIHSGKDNKGHCYVWVEGEAGRGSQEVGSCLVKHFKETVHSAKKVILWSDSCGGQNRNIKIVLILKTVLENHPSLQEIIIRFLVSGHSFLPNDSDFGDIECALKFQQRMYKVEDYLNVMETCRKKNPLLVHRMKKEEFVGTEDLEKLIVNRKKDTNQSKINWLKTREIRISKDHPFSIFMKTDFHGSEVQVDLDRKSRRGRPSLSGLMLCQNLKQLWPNGKPISVPKLNDIKFLMNLIPNDCRQFYKSLFSTTDDVQDDIDGFNGVLDFEIEEEESV